jgi:hypothetical protein
MKDDLLGAAAFSTTGENRLNVSTTVSTRIF